MKIIVALEIDYDRMIESLESTGVGKIEPGDGTVAEAVEKVLDWLEEDGICTLGVIEPDEISSNDQKLGNEIRKYLTK